MVPDYVGLALIILDRRRLRPGGFMDLPGEGDDLERSVGRRRQEVGSRPVSRVLSRAAIHLDTRHRVPQATYPGTVRTTRDGEPSVPLFGLAPGGVYRAAECYHRRGALLPHLFTLAGACALRRSVFCGTFRRLAPPRRYLAPRPLEPGLSSMSRRTQRLPGRLPDAKILAPTGGNNHQPGGISEVSWSACAKA